MISTEQRRRVVRYAGWAFVIHALLVTVMVIMKHVFWGTEVPWWHLERMVILIDLPMEWAIRPSLQSLPFLPGWSVFNSVRAAAGVRGNPGAVQNITNAIEALASPAGPSASPGLPQIAKQLATAERIGTALKADPAHRAASFGLDAVAKAGQSFSLKGGDGVTRTLIQAPGGMNGKLESSNTLSIKRVR